QGGAGGDHGVDAAAGQDRDGAPGAGWGGDAGGGQAAGLVQGQVVVVVQADRPAAVGHRAGGRDVLAEADQDPAAGLGGGGLGGPVGGEGAGGAGQVQRRVAGQRQRAGRVIDPDPPPRLGLRRLVGDL